MQELCLDETVIPWRGFNTVRKYTHSKPSKNGLVIQMLCESSTGYVSNFQMNCEKPQNEISDSIFTILKPFVGLGHHLYLENRYMNTIIAETLLSKKVRICGPVRCKLPGTMKYEIKNLYKNESIYRRKGDVLLQVWRDNYYIKMMSTIHDASLVPVVKNNKPVITKPRCIVDYNKYAKGVNQADQCLSDCGILRKSKKWTKKVVLFLINCALYNSYVVFKVMNPQKRLHYKAFLKEVARTWCSTEIINIKQEVDPLLPSPSTTEFGLTKRAPYKDHPGRLSGNIKDHFITLIIGSGKKKYPQRICRVCAAHKKRSETRYTCNFCGVPLHKGDCFQKYHTLKEY